MICLTGDLHYASLGNGEPAALRNQRDPVGRALPETKDSIWWRGWCSFWVSACCGMRGSSGRGRDRLENSTAPRMPPSATCSRRRPRSSEGSRHWDPARRTPRTPPPRRSCVRNCRCPCRRHLTEQRLCRPPPGRASLRPRGQRNPMRRRLPSPLRRRPHPCRSWAPCWCRPLRLRPRQSHRDSNRSPGLARAPLTPSPLCFPAAGRNKTPWPRRPYTARRDWTPYIVQTELGSKGLWWRTLTGYYRTQAEAAQAKNALKRFDAVVVKTPFANLIGQYGSETEAGEAAARVALKEVFPYIMKGPGNSFQLMAGAFPSQQAAEMHRRELDAKGVSTRTVQR